MTMPSLTIDLNKITENTSLVARLLKKQGLRLVGVTKACLGNEVVAEAMLAGGAAALADSHIESIAGLRRHFPETELQLLRSPVAGIKANNHADLFFVSSQEQAEAMLKMCASPPLRLCLMVETGDLREGVPSGLAIETAEAISEMKDVELAGVATNAACARESAPLSEALLKFSRVVEQLRWRLKLKAVRTLPVVSAGGSGLLGLMTGVLSGADDTGDLFGPLTELRCGEAILLGRIPSGGTVDLFLPEAHRDSFLLEGSVLEVFEKAGQTRALVDLGRQDVGTAGLIPCREGITPVEVSSDYLTVVCDPPESIRPIIAVGDRLSFMPSYYALLAAMTSPYIEKRFV